MTALPDAIEFTLDDGTTVAVAALRSDGSDAVGLGDRLQSAEKTLRAALTPVTAAAMQVLDGFRGLARSPQEIEVSFGVTLDGKLGGVIAAANTGAHLEVKLRWRGSDPEDDAVDALGVDLEQDGDVAGGLDGDAGAEPEGDGGME